MMIANVQMAEEPFAPCERMAAAIVEILKSNGKCCPKDLEKEGFEPEEVTQHWRVAYGLAKVELRWLEA